MGKANPAVVIPPAERDKPAWVKVGVIAAVGFVVGIAWPRAFGVKLGPSAPSEASSAAASVHRSPEAPPASVASKPAGSAPAAVVAPTTAPAPAPPTINVLRGQVTSCKTDDGETKRGKECGGLPALDKVVGARIRQLATCPAAGGQNGKLAVVVNADFAANKLGWDVGKGSNVGNVDALSSCLKTHMQGLSVASVAHEHPRYSITYNATFTSAASATPATPTKEARDVKEAGEAKDAKEAHERDAKDAKDDSPAPPPPANPGEAQVGWEVALVRDVPKTGQVVARLPRGAKVKVGTAKDGWFSIKFGDDFAKDGWVYRGAIGR